jgi:selenocysteine-specific elongation factor
VAVRGDRYILRRPSPSETLGGGAVMDPHPAKRHRRFDPALLERLEALQRGTPSEILAQSFLSSGPAAIRDAVARTRLGSEQASAALAQLFAEGQLVLLEAGEVRPEADLLAATAAAWAALSDKAMRELESYHGAYPLRRGMSREELKSRLKLSPRLFNAAVRRWAAQLMVDESGPQVARSGHKINLSGAQQAAAARLLAHLAAAPFTTPAVKECQAEAGEDVFQALLDLGQLVQVSPEVVFRREDYDALVTIVREHFQRESTLTVSQLRDRLNTSRKYVLGLLEHLDALGVTRRDGDFRRLK